MRQFYLCLPLLLLLFPSGCASVPKLVAKGKLATAYAKAAQHCTRARARNRTPKPKATDNYLLAYAAVQDHEYTQSQAIRRQESPEKWIALYGLYGSLHRRSRDLAEIFPYVASFGGNPDLLPATLETYREEARRKAGTYTLSLAHPWLPQARKGYKTAAREAHGYYLAALTYLPERSFELVPTRDSLKDIGTLRIVLYATDDSADKLLRTHTEELAEFHRGWTTILSYFPEHRVDLVAELAFTDYRSTGPEAEESSQQYSKRVVDYIEKKGSGSEDQRLHYGEKDRGSQAL